MSVPTTELGDVFVVNGYDANMAGVTYDDCPSGGAEDRLHANKEITFTYYSYIMDDEHVIFSAPKINMESLIWIEDGSSVEFEDASVNFDDATWDLEYDTAGKIIFSGDSKLNLTSKSNKLLIICNDISGTITLDLDDSFVSGSTFSIQANSANNLIINNADGYEVIPTTDGAITTYTVNRVSMAKEIKQITIGEETYLLKDETARNGLKNIPVKDVQINGTTILADGVANIPIAAAGGKLGLVFPAGFGIGVTATGALAINKATDALLSAKTNNFQPVVPSNLDSAVKVGLTTNAITLTGTEKANACNWLGAQQISTIQALNATDSITLTDGYIYNGGEQTALTIALPTYVDVSFLCEIDFTSGATATTLTYPQSGVVWVGDDISNNVFTPVANKRYTVICAYDGINYRFVVKGV